MAENYSFMSKIVMQYLSFFFAEVNGICQASKSFIAYSLLQIEML